MTRSDFDRALRVVGAELRDIVVSYFSPVTAAVKGIRWSVERVSRHFHSTGGSTSGKPSTRH
jgi:hypothetical protein